MLLICADYVYGWHHMAILNRLKIGELPGWRATKRRDWAGEDTRDFFLADWSNPQKDRKVNHHSPLLGFHCSILFWGDEKKTVEVGGFTFLRLLGESWLLVPWLQLGGNRSALGPAYPPKKKEVKHLSRFIGLWVAVVHVTVVFTEDLVGLRWVMNRLLGKFGYVCLTHFYKVCICNTFFGPPQDKTMFDDSWSMDQYKVTHTHRCTCALQQWHISSFICPINIHQTRIIPHTVLYVCLTLASSITILTYSKYVWTSSLLVSSYHSSQ